MKKLLFTLCLLLATKAYAQQVTPFQMASFVFQGVSFVLPILTPKELEMRGVGYGKTKEEAIQNALIDSVQKGIGILIVTDQTIHNDKVIRNMAAAYSSGVVNNYRVESCEFDKCIVIARVSPWNFRRSLEGDSSVVKVNGDNLYAQAFTARAALIQRHKLTEYYLQSIRLFGLEVKIREVKIIPSMKETVTFQIDYDIRFNRQFKNDIISFLERLERDTNGKSKGDEAVYIQWGPTGLAENRVYIDANDANTRSMMMKYLHQPIEVYFPELNHCQKINVKNTVFTVDWYDYRQRQVFEINPKQLQNMNRISAKIGC